MLNSLSCCSFESIEEKEALKKIKIGNINLIADLYLNNLIPIKIIQECLDYLLKNINEEKVLFLCELVKKSFTRLEFDDETTLKKICEKLETFL